MGWTNVKDDALPRIFRLAGLMKCEETEAMGVVVWLWRESQDQTHLDGTREEILEWAHLYGRSPDEQDRWLSALERARLISPAPGGRYLIHGNDVELEARLKRTERAKKGGEKTRAKYEARRQALEEQASAWLDAPPREASTLLGDSSEQASSCLEASLEPEKNSSLHGTALHGTSPPGNPPKENFYEGGEGTQDLVSRARAREAMAVEGDSPPPSPSPGEDGIGEEGETVYGSTIAPAVSDHINAFFEIAEPIPALAGCADALVRRIPRETQEKWAKAVGSETAWLRWKLARYLEVIAERDRPIDGKLEKYIGSMLTPDWEKYLKERRAPAKTRAKNADSATESPPQSPCVFQGVVVTEGIWAGTPFCETHTLGSPQCKREWEALHPPDTPPANGPPPPRINGVANGVKGARAP